MRSFKVLVLFVLLGGLPKFILADIPPSVRLPVSCQKMTALVFPEKIKRVTLGNKEFHIQKLNDMCVLVKAKKSKAIPTTILVEYSGSSNIYIGEIYASTSAPQKHEIKSEKQNLLKEESGLGTEKKTLIKKNKAQNKIWRKSTYQEYKTYGEKKGRVNVILTNILVSKETLYLRIFVHNKSSIHLNLSDFRFVYIDYLRRFLGMSFKPKKEEVALTLTPTEIDLGPKKYGYYEFGIPTKPINGELEINLAEKNTERHFKIYVPASTILKAKTTKNL